jgi:3-oxoadipate enol-lactonase
MQIRINDFSMNYEGRGHGTGLLFIHGFPLSNNMWKAQVEDLSDIARVVAPDLRGHGASEAVKGTYGMDLLADDCAALLDQIGLKERVVVCGLSMGGYVTLAFYRRYPQRVRGLILAATRAQSDSPEAKTNREKAAAKAKEGGSSAIAADLLPKILAPQTYNAQPGLVEQIKNMMEQTSVEGIIGASLGMKERPDSRPTLEDIDVPTLILHGADDQIISPDEARQMNASIPDSQLQVLPEAGHLLNMEKPDLFNQAVREFLKSLNR